MTQTVKALLVAPKNPRTLWSSDDALAMAGKDVLFPPTALLTIAGMLPEHYDIKVIDTNITPLQDEDIREADVILTSSMVIHWNSLEELIERANELETPVLAGGPLPTQYHREIKGNATFFLGEAEAGFFDALETIVEEGYKPETRIIDKRRQFRSLDRTPLQRFDLIQHLFQNYHMMAVQLTRGCPEKCTFCNIPTLYGDRTRLKNASRVIQEFALLYELGWRGGVMAVDDNLVGNQEAIIPILRQTGKWQKKHRYPYSLFTQASIKMYESPELMEAMYQAGFADVFIGIESPSKESLKSMGAQKNLQARNERGNVPMLEKVVAIQENYFRVCAGFILGLDKDPDNIADLMKQFIHDARIGVAMVGPLGVLPDTADYKRYSSQGRLVENVRYAGNSGVFTRQLSFVPHDSNGNEIDPSIILNRHREVVEHVNNPKNYFERSLAYLTNRKRKPLPKVPVDMSQVRALFNSIYQQGIKSGYRGTYWKYLLDVVVHSPGDFAEAIHHAVQGHHLIRTTREALRADDYIPHTESLYEKFGEKAREIYERGGQEVQQRLERISRSAHKMISRAERRYDQLHKDFRSGASKALETLREKLDAEVLKYRTRALEPAAR